MFAWHVHHKVLYEQLLEGGIDERAKYIRECKPVKERPRRLRLLALVKGQQVLDALDNAVKRARDKWTGNPSHPVRKALQTAINALHAEECKRCPWDGSTIFPKRKKK